MYNFRLFKTIKYSLITITAIIILAAGYLALVNQNSKVSKNEPIKNANVKEDIKLKVVQPSLIGIDGKQGPYFVQAKEMQEISGKIFFTSPKIKFMLNHLDWLNAISKNAELITDSQHLFLQGDLHLNLNQEYYFEGEEAEILAKESLIKSQSYVKLFNNEAVLESANGLLLNYQEETAFFHGKINAKIKQAKSKSIVNINSDKLDIFWNKKEGHFIGNVLLVDKDSKLEAEKMIAVVDPKSNKLKTIYAYGNVKITDKTQAATREYGEYNIVSSILTLKTNVKLYQKGDVLSGELLHYNLNTKKAKLIGENKKSKGRVRAIITPPSKK